MFSLLHFVLLTVRIVDGLSIIRECLQSSNGADYRGYQQTTSTGLPCLCWMNVTRDYNVTAFSDLQSGVGNHTYCRNPDVSSKPWCYVTDKERSATQRQECAIHSCQDQTTASAEMDNTPTPSTPKNDLRDLPQSVPANSEAAAVQTVVGLSQRVQSGTKKKKDLGTLGYVLGILMMAIIILLGVGITLGYFYKRGRHLKQKHEQRLYEREMQRITLPLSAFSNPACELVEENTVIINPQQSPADASRVVEGVDPLIGPVGTPGA